MAEVGGCMWLEGGRGMQELWERIKTKKRKGTKEKEEKREENVYMEVKEGSQKLAMYICTYFHSQISWLRISQ